MKKIVLAYSGGLDTSYCLKKLSNEGNEVHAVNINTGGYTIIEIEKMKEKALKLGAHSFVSINSVYSFYEKIIKSNKTINLINHLKNDKSIEIYFLMGADNLINFHKWHKSKLISQKCNILVFDRHGYKKNSLKSKTFKQLSKANLEFIEFNKVNISSSQLRKI